MFNRKLERYLYTESHLFKVYCDGVWSMDLSVWLKFWTQKFEEIRTSNKNKIQHNG